MLKHVGLLTCELWEECSEVSICVQNFRFKYICLVQEQYLKGRRGRVEGGEEGEGGEEVMWGGLRVGGGRGWGGGLRVGRRVGRRVEGGKRKTCQLYVFVIISPSLPYPSLIPSLPPSLPYPYLIPSLPPSLTPISSHPSLPYPYLITQGIIY